jgi:hypothetical protein
VSLKGALGVTEVPSDRWDLGLDLLRSGGAVVLVEREVALGFQRRVDWPNADGMVHVCAYAETGPSHLTDNVVETHGIYALQLRADLIGLDPRLGDALKDWGGTIDYVYDYGNGAVRIGSIDRNGNVTLL